MKILITGGAGFIGKWFVKRAPRNWDIFIIDSLDTQVHSNSEIFPSEVKDRAYCIKDSILNIEKYLLILEDVDVLIHLASQTGTGQSMYQLSRYIQENLTGTAKLLEAISRLNNKPKKIILTSSRAIYGEGAYTDGNSLYYPNRREAEHLNIGLWEIYNEQGHELCPLKMTESFIPKPTSIYGLTKLWQEQLLNNFCTHNSIELAIFRLQNVYGPKQELSNPYTGIIGIFSRLIYNSETVEIFEDGLMTRDFIYVTDVTDVLEECVRGSKVSQGIFNIGSGQKTSLIQLVEELSNVIGKELFFKLSGRYRVGDIRHAVSDTRKLESNLGYWKPIQLNEGLREYIHWFRQQNIEVNNQLYDSFSEMKNKGLLNNSKNQH